MSRPATRAASTAPGGTGAHADGDAGPDHHTWHKPVMLKKAVFGWHRRDKVGGYYVDGTVGGGGHTYELLSQDPKAQVLCLDRDVDALRRAQAVLEPFASRVKFVHNSYANMPKSLEEAGFPQRVDGILLDLGFNSNQIETAERGFSLMRDGPLDMRFDQVMLNTTAADLVNHLPEAQLVKIFRDYGEDPFSTVAARIICERRDAYKRPFTSTLDLANELETRMSKGKWFRRYRRHKAKSKRWRNAYSLNEHPATRVFQALRIAVNEEIQQLERFMAHADEYLDVGGRLAVIAFHSLEDRIVKIALREMCQQNDELTMEYLTRAPITPSDAEIAENPRCRSSRMRVAHRIETSPNPALDGAGDTGPAGARTSGHDLSHHDDSASDDDASDASGHDSDDGSDSSRDKSADAYDAYRYIGTDDDSE